MSCVIKDGCMSRRQSRTRSFPGSPATRATCWRRNMGSRSNCARLSEAEVRSADELWLSSLGREVLPDHDADGRPVGAGVPGPMFKRMWSWFQDAKRADARRWQARKSSGAPRRRPHERASGRRRAARARVPTDSPDQDMGRSDDGFAPGHRPRWCCSMRPTSTPPRLNAQFPRRQLPGR